MRYAIEVNYLTVDYGHVRALTDINMKVAVNEFLAIIGPNGGGKSTLLKALLGLIKPTSGTIRIMGMPSHKASGLIGYVPQFLKFDKHFPIRVMDVVLMGRLKGGRTLFHRYSGRDREIARQMLKRLEIEHLENRQIGQLSGGQLQRVLIARALAVQPKILMLDEPTASVDSHSKSHIYEILQELNKDMTIILVTHDTNVVSTYVKTIACLNERLFYHGNTELDDQVMEEVYGCPVEIIAHGVPHRVLKEHKGVKE